MTSKEMHRIAREEDELPGEKGRVAAASPPRRPGTTRGDMAKIAQPGVAMP